MSRILIILLFISSNICLGQKIDGTYVLDSKLGGGGRTLYFSNGTFSDIFSHNLSSKSIGKGTFKIDRGKISLHYLKQPNQDTSAYTVEQQASNTDKGNVTVRVLDEQNLNTPGWIELLNNKGHVLATLFNSGKEASNFLISDKQVTSIRVTFIGYTSVIFSTKRLMGMNSTITVTLHPVTKVFIEPRIVRYHIKKNTIDSLLLYDDKKVEHLFIREKL